MGYAYEETFTDGAYADAGIMTAHNLPTAKNLMVWRTTGETKQVVSYALNLEINQGDFICRIGRTSDRDCANVTDESATRWSEIPGFSPRTLIGQVVWGFDSKGGDSGGPYFMYLGGTYGPTVKAYGIHIHSLDPPYAESWFSTFGRSADQLSLEWGVVIQLCTTAAC